MGGALDDPWIAWSPEDGWERFQILALDGGGLKGVFSVAILASFEQDLGIRIVDHFDLITGTSTGGLIALGLGAGVSPAELVEFYADLGPRIFNSRLGFRRIRQIFRAKYDAGALRAALVEVFGDLLLGDSQKRLVVPAFNLGEDGVHVFKTPHHPRLTRDWKIPMVDVGLSTSAAPTFFPAHRLDHGRLIDGGVWANNPAVVGVAEAVSMLGVPLESIRLFSLGTTTDLKHRAGRLDRGGIASWARSGSILDVVLGGQSVGANNLVQHFLGKTRVLRINPAVPAGFFALDRADAQELIGKASSHSRVASPSFESLFLDHKAPAYAPLHPKREEIQDVRNT